MWGGSQSTSSDGSAAGDIEDRFYDLVGYLNDLSWLRRTSYPFLPFAVDDGGPGITYGLVLGYRQRWEPTGYQVGELVKSVPLAPKSTTRYSTKRKRVRSYSEKRLQASESTYSSEEVDVSRDVSKIANASKHGTSFTLSNDVGVTVPGVGIGGNSKATWERSASKESQSTKEAFREETHKQAELHKQSQSLEVTFSTVDELDTEVTSEISNPNDEIVVTYLFYELQRRFMVSEHLHAVTPVVLVAQPIPAPGALDATWLARYDWILRRVLLDKSFAAALGWAVSGKVVADKGRVEQLEANLDRQAALVEALKKDLVDFRDLSWVVPDSDSVAEFLQVVIYDREHPGWRDDEAKVREVFGDEVADRLALRKKTTASKEEELKKEVGRLESAIAAFIAGFTNYATEAIQVERLLLHIKDNILYYMQAIWEHEGRDQRYLRLRHVSVPNVVGPIQYEFGVSDGPPRAPTFRVPVSVTAAALLRVDGDVELGDIADLAVPLGFVGNAMVFPLMRWDPLVEFMMVPYACAFTGVSDPDAGAGMTMSEIRELVCCLKRELQPDEWQALTAAIDASWNARVVDPRPDAEELMVPTGSLIIEALPGRHALLESFKLAHRALDVQQVASDLVTKRLEQLRMAARILSGDLEDPSIDKKVTVEGTDSVLVSPGPDN